jgi:hypothetical protein
VKPPWNTIGVADVIGTLAFPSVKDPDVTLEYMHESTATFVYGQYLKLTKSPVGAAAEADDTDTPKTPAITAAAISGRKDLFIRPLLVDLGLFRLPAARRNGRRRRLIILVTVS